MNIPRVVMQVCDPAKGFGDYMRSFEFIKAATCVYANEAGMLVTGLLVYGAVASNIYIRTGSFVIPFVLMLLTGGAVLSQVASIASPIAVLLLLVVPAGIVTLAYYIYST